MYATHATLVDHESYTFMKRGFDVYTAAWATNTRSRHSSTRPVELNPLHPYRGKCDFLSEAVIEVLSKIDVSNGSVIHVPEVGKALVDNFDILYVFQVTPWLLVYAEEFLKQGKKVIFRTSGIPLWSWGKPANYESLMIYPNFYLLASNPFELTIGAFKGMQVPLIRMSLHPELIDTTVKLDFTLPTVWAKPNEKFVLAVGETSLKGDIKLTHIMQNIGIDYKMINRGINYFSPSDCDKLFNTCYLFFDMNTALLRYSPFEAILHNKAVLVIENGDMHKYMTMGKGVNVGFEYWHRGYEDTNKIKFYVDNSVALDRVYQAQRLWLDGLLIEASDKWDKFIEENIND